MVERQRLDRMMVKKGLVAGRQRAQHLIHGGKVLVNGFPAAKPGSRVTSQDHIAIREDDLPFVGRAGLKLAEALKAFGIDVSGKTCIDVGASTGGFTDCLLQNGAGHVYAVDVGYGQMAWSLRQDSRVTVIERTNIRHMPQSAIPRPVDIAVIDVSFISLKIVLPATLPFLASGAVILALIKPQFEVGKGKVGKGGIVRESSLHQEVIDDLSKCFKEMSLSIQGVIPSPIRGSKGNQEFIICMTTGERVQPS